MERLPGNVGPIDLRSLPNPDLAGRSIAAAMSLVAHTGALIFDLRQNRGGWPECVVFWNSYLFADGDMLLNTIEARGKEQARQFWTLAAVPGDRYLDRPVYVLTSGTTFSGGEEFAYNLQARGAPRCSARSPAAARTRRRSSVSPRRCRCTSRMPAR